MDPEYEIQIVRTNVTLDIGPSGSPDQCAVSLGYRASFQGQSLSSGVRISVFLEPGTIVKDVAKAQETARFQAAAVLERMAEALRSETLDR